ncbi:glycosyltransferase family 8 protein [Arcticibacter sp. MXS-1]|uniref:glycosyltransferase family 8 protein n=1 Tax=Arcticibacter sp. MXS-1 TaxID=3341726 RepID=UPI0035A9543D
MSDKASVAITIDDNYVQHACVMLQSLMDNNIRRLDVFCVCSGLSRANLTSLRNHFKKTRLQLHFIEFPKYLLPVLPIRPGEHITAASFFRIWLPELLYGQDGVLFLDSDIIVNGDISCLLDLNIGDRAVAAIEDPGIDERKKEDLGIPPNQKYFNAGVLIMNLNYFRKHDLTKKTAQFIRAHPDKCEFHDQDALNAVIKGAFIPLGFHYNCQSVLFEEPFISQSRFTRALTKPAVIHFTGRGDCKPWALHNSHPMKGLYYHYLKRTPFYNYSPPGAPPITRKFGILRTLSRKAYI